MSRTEPHQGSPSGSSLSSWCQSTFGSIRKAAKELDVSFAHLSYLSRGERKAGKRVARVLREAGFGGAL